MTDEETRSGVGILQDRIREAEVQRDKARESADIAVAMAHDARAALASEREAHKREADSLAMQLYAAEQTIQKLRAALEEAQRHYHADTSRDEWFIASDSRPQLSFAEVRIPLFDEHIAQALTEEGKTESPRVRFDDRGAMGDDDPDVGSGEHPASVPKGGRGLTSGDAVIPGSTPDPEEKERIVSG